MSQEPVGLTKNEEDKRFRLKREKPRVYEKITQYSEKVRRRESIAIIQFQYNYICNFRCAHCSVKKFQGKKEARSFTPRDVADLARQADELGLAHFVITGGEPLVFRDFDDVVASIDPQRFYITSDTNGWLLDHERAQHMKQIGVDKIQLSLDSLSEKEHDEFRRAPGSHLRALNSISAAQDAGLDIIVQTVVTKQRLRSEEFEEFLAFLNGRGVPVFVTYAKPVGTWEGNFDVLVNKEDMSYMRDVLEKKYNVFTHLTPSYGMDLGCIGVKRMISVTQYGDVMPCPYIHVSLGNVFEEPLRDIIERGLRTKLFGRYYAGCYIAEDRHFIGKYVEGRIYGKELPVHYSEFFDEQDFEAENRLAPEAEGVGPLKWR